MASQQDSQWGGRCVFLFIWSFPEKSGDLQIIPNFYWDFPPKNQIIPNFYWDFPPKNQIIPNFTGIFHQKTKSSQILLGFSTKKPNHPKFLLGFSTKKPNHPQFYWDFPPKNQIIPNFTGIFHQKTKSSPNHPQFYWDVPPKKNHPSSHLGVPPMDPHGIPWLWKPLNPLLNHGLNTRRRLETTHHSANSWQGRQWMGIAILNQFCFKWEFKPMPVPMPLQAPTVISRHLLVTKSGWCYHWYRWFIIQLTTLSINCGMNMYYSDVGLFLP